MNGNDYGLGSTIEDNAVAGLSRTIDAQNGPIPDLRTRELQRAENAVSKTPVAISSATAAVPAAALSSAGKRACSVVSLFETETHLGALVDSLEMVEPGQEEEFVADFRDALATAADKRDRVGEFMAHLESQISLAKLEMGRLKARKVRYERTLERMEHYVAAVIQSLGQDRRGKWQTLEGNTVTFRLKNNPPSVAITDEASIPARYKTLTITLPAVDWERLLDSVPLDIREYILSRICRPEAAVLKASIAADLKAEIGEWKEWLNEQQSVEARSIPGAVLVPGGISLVRE